MSALCTRPEQFGYCLPKKGRLARAVGKMCGGLKSDVFAVAAAAGANLNGVRLRQLVIAPGHRAETTESTWQFAGICAWGRPHKMSEVVEVKVGLLWQPPVITDCSASPIGTCTQLTAHMFRVDDQTRDLRRYRINGVVGGAELTIYGISQKPSGALTRADTRATRLAAKVLAEIDA